MQVAAYLPFRNFRLSVVICVETEVNFIGRSSGEDPRLLVIGDPTCPMIPAFNEEPVIVNPRSVAEYAGRLRPWYDGSLLASFTNVVWGNEPRRLRCCVPIAVPNRSARAPFHVNHKETRFV